MIRADARSQHLGDTWLEPEELAYNTYAGGPCGSGRRARVRCPNGRLHIVRAGVPDTYWTIPAVGRINGRYSAGTIMINRPGEDDSEFVFYPRRTKDT